MTSNLRRHLAVGAAVAALAGAIFALAVVSLADCGGPGCTAEAVIGVIGHALGGAVAGALVGGAIYRFRR